ncbi:DUF3575 domain-containing protein [Bacteroides gallinarum]|uniref:DUF3575 domain-containing protein n=1 Tax=Bacteroides gallinarum TaxID=376806 RepID=UPI00037A037D|nr:DUF3575 domain-containing protein [Bacteroides gallinarum]
MNLKKPILTLLFVLSLLPLAAQEPADTSYLFRFKADNDMFYVPFGENGKELQRLQECVKRHKADILAGKIPLHVDGYSISASTEAENLAMAKTRSNRVKSELITRSGLVEKCFTTCNHASDGNFVTVRFAIPAEKDVPDSTQTEADSIAAERAKAEQAEKARLAAEREAARRAEEERLAAERAEQERRTAEEAARKAELEKTEAERLAAEETEKDDYTLSLRANLLRWATLTPNLGIEWRVNPSWGILVNGAYTSWAWNDKDRRYALWEVSPEVRYYIGKEKRGYIGAMYKAGQFNYKFSATGKQGDLMGGGITGGYQLRLNKTLSLDFNLGIGCVHADYEKYEVIDGVRVRRGTESKNWWGPVNAGITLVWKLF